jgi:hypothetical protein
MLTTPKRVFNEGLSVFRQSADIKKLYFFRSKKRHVNFDSFFSSKKQLNLKNNDIKAQFWIFNAPYLSNCSTFLKNNHFYRLEEGQYLSTVGAGN